MIFAAGYGEHRPVASNLTPEGRALNRRADLVILYPPVRFDLTTGDAEFDLVPAPGGE